MAKYVAKFQCRNCGDWAESIVLEANTMYQASIQQMNCSNCDGQDTMEVTELLEKEAAGTKPGRIWRISRDEPKASKIAKITGQSKRTQTQHKKDRN